MSRFQAEREAFLKFKNGVENDPELMGEIENALDDLFSRFSTSIRENRFVVGGAVEVILVAGLRAAGIDAKDVGPEEKRVDIEIPGGGFSVKGHFSGSGDIRLINVLGTSQATAWDTATLFVLHRLGMGYADPDTIGRGAVRRLSDAVVLRYRDLENLLVNNPQWLIRCKVPSVSRDLGHGELVSRVVAQEVLRKTRKLKEAMGL